MKYSELKRKLQKAGCLLKREGAGHEVWFSPLTGKNFFVGRHDKEDVAIGTLKNISKSSGVKL